MQCWLVVTVCCVLFFISVSVPTSGWYLAIAVPLPVAPATAPPRGVTVVAPKALVAAGAPNNDVEAAAGCPKIPPAVAVLGVPKIELAGCAWGVAEKPPNPVVAGFAAPKAVVPACPNSDVFCVAVLAPKTEVFAWDWKPRNDCQLITQFSRSYYCVTYL